MIVEGGQYTVYLLLTYTTKQHTKPVCVVATIYSPIQTIIVIHIVALST